MRINRRTCLGMLGCLALSAAPIAGATTQAPCGCGQEEPPMALFFGDSITAYTGASDQAHGFTSLIAAGLGVGQDNRGVSGDVLVSTLAVIEQTTVPPRYDVVVWLAGYNDMRVHGTDASALATFQANMLTGLTYLTSRRRSKQPTTARERLLFRRGKLGTDSDACPVFVGNCLRMTASGYPQGPAPYDQGSDAAATAYNVAIAATVALAQQNGRPVTLVDTSAAYNPNTMVSGDNVHPGDIGHAAIATAFLAAMRAQAS